MKLRGWAGAAAVSVMGAAIAGCGQQAPPDLSYILVELDSIGVATDAVVVVTPPSPKHASTVCIRLEDQGSATPASFVLYLDHDDPPTPAVELTVTSYNCIDDQGASGGMTFLCPSPLPPVPVATQSVSLDFCQYQSVKVQIQVGSVCPECTSGDGCAVGLTPDGLPCPAGACCANPIPNACALEQAPTTTTMAPP